LNQQRKREQENQEKESRFIMTPSPKIKPVGSIKLCGAGVYNGKIIASVFRLLDDSLVRIPINDDNSYNYDAATIIEDTHKIHTILKKDPNKKARITIDEEVGIGSPVSPEDISWLKEKIEKQHQENYEKLKAKGWTLEI